MDGTCQCCGRVGSTHEDLNDPPDDPRDPGPLCDQCDYAQKRWDAWQRKLECPGTGYPYMDPPPKSPPIKRGPWRRGDQATVTGSTG
jgi:hypothetical protein